MEDFIIENTFALIEFIELVISVIYTMLQGSIFFLSTIHIGYTVMLITVSFVLFLPIRALNKALSSPYRLAKRILRKAGWLHDHRTWGIVYDSVTKEPIDPAYVTVKSRLGNTVATALTDLDGRFGIILPIGTYTLTVEKTNYIFPSRNLLDQNTDGYYTDLYFGNPIEVTKSERMLALAVPMDPIASDWNQEEKKRKSISLRSSDRRDFRNTSLVYFLIAGLLVVSRYLVIGSTLSKQLVVIYFGLFIAGIIYSLLKPASYFHSVIIEKSTGKPLGFARVKVFKKINNMQVASKISSYNGQFVCLVPNGIYYVTIEKRDSLGIYNLVQTSPQFEVIDGSINRRFVV